jgi:DNA gyrase/topoisomerase IV subunit B
MNNGPGISITYDHIHNEWTPEVVCTHLYSGDNFQDESRTTAGMNGCGLKLVNYNSHFFSLTTVSITDGMKQSYYQEFYDGTKRRSPAVVTDNSSEEEHTKITYVIDAQDNNPVTDYQLYSCLFTTRIIMTSYWLMG